MKRLFKAMAAAVLLSLAITGQAGAQVTVAGSQDAAATADFKDGIVLQQQGRLEEAISKFRMALRADPNYAEVHNALGVALLHMGRRAEAVAEFRKALEIKPGYAEASKNLDAALQGKDAAPKP